LKVLKYAFPTGVEQSVLNKMRVVSLSTGLNSKFFRREMLSVLRCFHQLESCSFVGKINGRRVVYDLRKSVAT
jgi:hypothetical protein